VNDVSTPRKSKKAEVEAEIRDFDWSQFDALSDMDIERAAASDPYTVLLTDSELADADLVVPATARKRNKHAAE
jgi:hypothetical protein